METITLADGTVIENSHVLQDEDNLFFYIQCEMTLASAFALMNDQQKTSEITAFRYQQETVYEGYSVLCSISKDRNQISGRLRRTRA